MRKLYNEDGDHIGNTESGDDDTQAFLWNDSLYARKEGTDDFYPVGTYLEIDNADVTVVAPSSSGGGGSGGISS